MPPKARHQAQPAKLRRQAELKLKRTSRQSLSPRTEADTNRLLNELQVHHLELEMQKVEMQAGRDKVETLLETYLDLYDFAPVGYFSVDEQGTILEVNLTGAALLGVERSRLINQRLRAFVDPSSRSDFLVFF